MAKGTICKHTIVFYLVKLFPMGVWITTLKLNVPELIKDGEWWESCFSLLELKITDNQGRGLG